MIIKELQEFYQIIKPGQPIIGIDYGEKKCGIAISNPEATIAMPLTLINKIKLQDKIDAIIEVTNKYNAAAVVIGLPINMDGSQGRATDIVQKFATGLEKIIDLPIYLQDERLTTKTANNMLKAIGIKRKERNAKDDAAAASLVLETVLEARRYCF